MTVLAAWTRAWGLGQSSDDVDEDERLNYKKDNFHRNLAKLNHPPLILFNYL